MAWRRLLLAAVCVLVMLLAGIRDPAAQVGPGGSGRWYKGNTHTHTLNSDGDSTPDDVAKWYREHGYRFLVLSDHNVLTNVDGLNAVHAASEQFLVIKGEEVTDRFGDKPIHINGLDVSENVEPQHGSSVLDVVQRTVEHAPAPHLTKLALGNDGREFLWLQTRNREAIAADAT